MTAPVHSTESSWSSRFTTQTQSSSSDFLHKLLLILQDIRQASFNWARCVCVLTSDNFKLMQLKFSITVFFTGFSLALVDVCMVFSHLEESIIKLFVSLPHSPPVARFLTHWILTNDLFWSSVLRLIPDGPFIFFWFSQSWVNIILCLFGPHLAWFSVCLFLHAFFSSFS